MHKKRTASIWKNLPMEMRPKIRYWLPAACMREEDLRTELRQLAARGFGGVEIVVLQTLAPDLARSEDGWGTKNWDHMMDVIAEETERLGISLDIAIGPGWPIASPTLNSADDPGAGVELTWGVLEASGGEEVKTLPAGRTVREEGTPIFVHAGAYQKKQDGSLSLASYIDLDANVCITKTQDHFPRCALSLTLPGTKADVWEVFAFYIQPTAAKINAGQTYVVDHLSQEGTDATARYWKEVFKNGAYKSMESFFCDSLEYITCLDWTHNFEKIFEQKRGYSLLPYLPFIGRAGVFPPPDVPGFPADDPALQEMVNNDYCEVLTQLYCENHLAGLEKLAESYGKTVRYQVAYNKPFEEERCPLYVGIPENEALGRPVIDTQKTMGAAVHLGRKPRYSFECAAEFGHSYGQSYDDLLWWVKRSTMAGMNAQVLHGASYSGAYDGALSDDGKIPGTAWPGYEGFDKIVSNYWNRTPDVGHARAVLDTIARINAVFRNQAKVDAAIFRQAYLNDGLGSEYYMYPDNGALSNAGYSYEFLSEFLLYHENAVPGKEKGRVVLDADGAAYRVLIIPEQQRITETMLEKVEQLLDAGLPIVWVGKKPQTSLVYAEWHTEEMQRSWIEQLEKVWNRTDLIHANDLQAVPKLLEKAGITPRIELKSSMNLATQIRVEDGEKMWFGLYGMNKVVFSPENPNPEEVLVSSIFGKGTTKGSYQRPGKGSGRMVSMKLEGQGTVYRCNPWDGSEEALPFTSDGQGHMTGQLFLEEDELVILRLESAVAANEEIWEEEQPTENKVHFSTVDLYAFEPDTPKETSFLRSRFRTEKKNLQLPPVLAPIKDLDASLAQFCGKAVYHGTIHATHISATSRYILDLGEVCDTFTVRVNGQETPFPDQVLKKADITSLLREGENELEVTVVTNLYNALLHEGMTFFGGMPLPYHPRAYGIFERDGLKIGIYERKRKD